MFVKPAATKKRYEYVIWNHKKLVAVLEGTASNAHNQAKWARKSSNHCGTAACAMGWAVLSGEFENMEANTDLGIIEFIRFRGEPMFITEAAEKEFGLVTLNDVFYNTKSSKCETITALKKRISKLEDELRAHEENGTPLRKL